MIDWKSLLYAPVYDIIGVDAVITPATNASAVTLTALDKTAGIEVSDGSGIDVGTVRPAAVIRKQEMLDAGLTPSDLEDANLCMNGKDWRVKSWFPRPSPTGEADGEIYLILIEEYDGQA